MRSISGIHNFRHRNSRDQLCAGNADLIFACSEWRCREHRPIACETTHEIVFCETVNHIVGAVIRVAKNGPIVEHVFEIRDWGGEHMANAFIELFTLESVNGMLIVVDLGETVGGEAGHHGVQFSEERIKKQIESFPEPTLRLCFNERIVSHCKTFTLFINKSDALSGELGEVERRALEFYAPLITTLRKLQRESGMVDIEILVGSASSGHNTQNLFAHFIEKILPADAYDPTLLQMMHTTAPGSATADSPADSAEQR